MQGILFIICSPSGGGKGTLIRGVLKRVESVGYSISYTTRQPRRGEIHGREYFFVSRDEFVAMRDSNAFLESATVHDNFYGTSKQQIEKELVEGRDIILEIDVQGAAIIKNLMPQSISVFIMPPSFETLRERLLRRGSEAENDLSLRLANARGEVERFSEFDYVIINDDLPTATENLASVIRAERVRYQRIKSIADEILTTFTEK